MQISTALRIAVASAAATMLLPTSAYAVTQTADLDLAATSSASAIPWHLDRIDQRSPKLDGVFAPINDGAGSTIYIMDSGIRYTHEEFEGRAVPGFDIDPGGNGSDCWGHGTVAAGLAGGKTNGVAKKATLVSVKVIACKAHNSLAEARSATDGALKGIAWLAAHAKPNSVVNMSLGYAPDQALDDAVRNLIATKNMTVVVSAGNGDDEGKPVDACTTSPARVREAIVVGASTRKDTPTFFSNMGPCVDVYAPGDGMKAPTHTADNSYDTLMGTSEAAPIVAGVIALHLSAQPTLAPAEMHALITSSATNAIKKAPAGTTSKLVFIGKGK